MLNEERRREILELLRNDGRALVRDLSKRFRTSLITIRKDLEYLHHRGMLERTHGGDVELRGLGNRIYHVTDYVDGKDFGTVTGPEAKLNVDFTGSLLLEAK